MDFYEHFRWAEDLFGHRDYRAAARLLERLLVEAEASPESVGHGLTDARLLLARAYYFSAQLRRAEETVRAVLADHPADAYAALLLAHTLRRGSRHEEADRAMALATALGAPGTGSIVAGSIVEGVAA
jgi:Flp pilus assembly protein TadD